MTEVKINQDWGWRDFVQEYHSSYGDFEENRNAQIRFSGDWRIGEILDNGAFQEALSAFEQSIRKDQHEKSCRAQKRICMDEFKKVDFEDYQTMAGYYSHQLNALFCAPLADFNDTITE